MAFVIQDGRSKQWRSSGWRWFGLGATITVHARGVRILLNLDQFVIYFPILSVPMLWFFVINVGMSMLWIVLLLDIPLPWTIPTNVEEVEATGKNEAQLFKAQFALKQGERECVCVCVCVSARTERSLQHNRQYSLVRLFPTFSHFPRTKMRAKRSPL